MADKTNGDRLLPGEQTSMSSGNLADAKHWVTVYAELVDFKDSLLKELREQRGRVQSEGQTEVDNDEGLLQREAARLRRRLEYWRAELDRRR